MNEHNTGEGQTPNGSDSDLQVLIAFEREGGGELIDSFSIFDQAAATMREQLEKVAVEGRDKDSIDALSVTAQRIVSAFEDIAKNIFADERDPEVAVRQLVDVMLDDEKKRVELCKSKAGDIGFHVSDREALIQQVLDECLEQGPERYVHVTQDNLASLIKIDATLLLSNVSNKKPVVIHQRTAELKVGIAELSKAALTVLAIGLARAALRGLR